MENKKGLVGYSVSDTFPIALTKIKELYLEDRIDKSIRRFLSLTEEAHLNIQNKKFLLAAKCISVNVNETKYCRYLLKGTLADWETGQLFLCTAI